MLWSSSKAGVWHACCFDKNLLLEEGQTAEAMKIFAGAELEAQLGVSLKALEEAAAAISSSDDEAALDDGAPAAGTARLAGLSGEENKGSGLPSMQGEVGTGAT